VSAPLFDLLVSALLPVAMSSHARAAVILLLSKGDNPSLLFTKRALHLRSHPGEVCFPGGMREPQDVDLLATALREMEEEIGLPASQVHVLGRLPDFHTRAGTQVASFVGSVDASYPLVPSLSELDSIFWVPLALFENGLKVREDHFEKAGHAYRIPVYHYQGYEIWGFTAAVTERFLKLVQDARILK
jgi:8-oxo-dGTP pyrophosphatase MutT (NUDIX family)